MDKPHRVDPIAALDKFYQVVREEATSNPTFGRRLLEAIGYTVIYRGDEAMEAVDPLLVAMKGKEEFFRTFLSFPDREIERIGVSRGLLLKGAIGKGKTKLTTAQLVDQLYVRTTDRLDDMFPKTRQAAE